MIKINGNRIEPAEIEAAAKEALGVDWCAAKGFVSSASYICLYYKDDIAFDEEEVRRKMEAKLPYYMIPSYFVKIDKIPLTNTGKFNRKALPKPAAKVNFAEYVPPSNEIEAKLCDAFAKVLNLERVGVNDDFFQLGGDSLSSMRVIAEFDSDDLTAEDMFKGRTAGKIARLYLENERNAGASWKETELESRKKAFPLSGVEKKYVEEIVQEKGKLGANISRLVAFPPEADSERICAAVNKMLRNRPIWGTVYYYDEHNDLRQKFDASFLPTVIVEKMAQSQFDSIKGELLPAWAPTENNMGVARVIETEANIYVLLGMSHAKVDGFSARMFWQDMLDAYLGRELPLDSYYSCLEEMEKSAATETRAESKDYFDKTYGKGSWLKCLPGDRKEEDYVRKFHRKPLPLAAEDIERAEKRLKASRNIIFLAITLTAISKMAGHARPMLNWTYMDRSGSRKANACGLLMKRLPVAVDFSAKPDFAEVLGSIQEQVINGVAHSDYEWICENESGLGDDVLSFVYQPANVTDTDLFQTLGAQLVEGVLPNPGTARRCAVMVAERNGRFIHLVNYMQGFYSEEYIDRFARIFTDTATELIKG